MNLRFLSLGLLALVGCSDPAAPGTPDVPATTDVGSTDAGSTDVAITPDLGGSTDLGGVDAGATDAGGGTDAGGSDVPAVTDRPTADVPGGAQLVINEIRATGDDWVELKNTGTTAIDLGGMVLADTDTEVDGGAPRVADGVTFPAGTSLGAGQYLLIVVGLSMPGMGPQMACLGDAGPMTCYHANFGISASRGERIYLLTSSGAELTHADYPMNAAPDGSTWGRLPDGTGGFAVTRPTPGAANAAP